MKRHWFGTNEDFVNSRVPIGVDIYGHVHVGMRKDFPTCNRSEILLLIRHRRRAALLQHRSPPASPWRNADQWMHRIRLRVRFPPPPFFVSFDIRRQRTTIGVTTPATTG